jgi:hypothetical protein
MVRLPIGCDTTTNGYSGLPQIAACAFALPMNWSVQITAVGTPRRSSSIPSCKLHVEQDPQSPIAVTTTSHCAASASSMASSAVVLAPFFATATTSRMS